MQGQRRLTGLSEVAQRIVVHDPTVVRHAVAPPVCVHQLLLLVQRKLLLGQCEVTGNGTHKSPKGHSWQLCTVLQKSGFRSAAFSSSQMFELQILSARLGLHFSLCTVPHTDFTRFLNAQTQQTRHTYFPRKLSGCSLVHDGLLGGHLVDARSVAVDESPAGVGHEVGDGGLQVALHLAELGGVERLEVAAQVVAARVDAVRLRHAGPAGGSTPQQMLWVFFFSHKCQ